MSVSLLYPWQQLLPNDVCIAVADKAIKDQCPELTAAEQVFIQNAVSKRRQEFALGRSCLRQCLKQLGHPDFSIAVGQYREPILPPGLVGSISHCEGYCVAAAAQQTSYIGLGLDVEINSPLPIGVQRLICTSTEQEQLATYQKSINALPEAPALSKLIFSMKESFYKAYFTIACCYFDFQDADVTLDIQQKQFFIQLNKPIHQQTRDEQSYSGHFAWDSQYLYTSIAIRNPNAA